MKTLTIISHTEHYNQPDGTIVGLGSTVTEINHLLEVFDKVIHIAMLHAGAPPPNTLPYASEYIEFVPLPAVGGTKVIDKLLIIKNAPRIIKTIRNAMCKTDYFQFRAPTGIGVYVIPYLIYFSKKSGWFKYAGNWKQEQAPITYRFQRWLLMHQNRKVTINGFWESQPKQRLSFENPCLTQNEIKNGRSIVANKVFKRDTQLCFVGRLETAKGLDLIIDALESFNADELSKIQKVHVVGDGPRIGNYKKKAVEKKLPLIFHGYLPRHAVHEIYKKCHAIILPSASEGFPKVISEAMNYGCVPIVSNVSSIGHYIKENENGFLIETLNAQTVSKVLHNFLSISEAEYKSLINCDEDEVTRFSYAYYNERIKTEIL
ncbi:glycosyltransferase [Psychroserpens sp. MEBiC05023]